MIFLTPIWFFALAAIVIPVVIHLWNIRPGKTLKVGSIALFSASSPKNSRSFKVLDILLLLLRCLLLIVLAVLLAVPLWRQYLPNTKAKGWLLIPKDHLNEAYHQFKPTVDSFSDAGYEFHYFDKGFNKADLNDILQHPGRDSTPAQVVNYWNLAKQLRHYAPANVQIFTPNTITNFAGNKPSTNLHINWHSFTPADSVETFLAGAWLTANGSVRVVQGTATPSGTNYQYNDIKNGGQNGLLYQVAVENGVPVVSFKNTKLKVDTATQRIAIYANKSTVDASYLKAALRAVSQFTQRKTIIKTYDEPDAIPINQDWLFWLSVKPAGYSVQKAKNIFVYADGKTAGANSWMSNTGAYNIPQGQAKIQLYTCITPGKIIGNTIWVDGFGKPVLSAEKGKANVYHFYSRFNPAFTDLVWSNEFPKWLLDLADPFKPVGKFDRRALSAKQIMPTYADQADIKEPKTGYINLTSYLWLLLALVFFSERWLATRNNLIPANG